MTAAVWDAAGNGGSIRHMRVPTKPIRLAGSWGYLTGSWGEATPYFTDIWRNIRENEPQILNWCLLHLLNYLGIKIVYHNLESINQEATLKTNMVEPA